MGRLRKVDVFMYFRTNIKPEQPFWKATRQYLVKLSEHVLYAQHSPHAGYVPRETLERAKGVCIHAYLSYH